MTDWKVVVATLPVNGDVARAAACLPQLELEEGPEAWAVKGRLLAWHRRPEEPLRAHCAAWNAGLRTAAIANRIQVLSLALGDSERGAAAEARETVSTVPIPRSTTLIRYEAATREIGGG
jgi:hypothetical protein